jgi:hypothetical protein
MRGDGGHPGAIHQTSDTPLTMPLSRPRSLPCLKEMKINRGGRRGALSKVFKGKNSFLNLLDFA